MKNRIAIIDLGTNTFHLLIAELQREKINLLHQETIPVRLGEGGMQDGLIKDSAFVRGLEALKQFKKTIQYHKVDYIKALGTSALRSASNGKDFIEEAFAKYGIKIDLIDGKREAELIYTAVRRAISIYNQKALIMDIGGGSVEFIICDEKELLWKKSFNIGAARLMSQFHHSDPISRADIDVLTKHLEHVLVELKEKIDKFKPSILIGSAGAFETFATMIDSNFEASFEQKEFTIAIKDFEKIENFIVKSTEEERKNHPAIPEVRVNMIVMACLLTSYVLKLHAFKEIKLSAYSMKEGQLFEIFDNQSNSL